ncbi:MAG: Exodeoxyribonuclease subunit gamma [Moraxellaceae bacterium]|jgi:exodeoxyribonuclease V gamma subunit|nr:Exodeoxyribonuclease subunit gamma [Moraxellaceae bacterium]
MLNLFQSNMLDALARLYLAVREPSRDPLEPETLLVPSHGMQRWLAFALAREQGIAANLDFQLPSAFLWDLMRRLFPDVPRRSPLDREPMAWRVLQQLPGVLEQESASVLAQWRAADARGRFELAWRVADVFDQYQMYRPAWLLAWEQGRRLGLGEDEAWQALLWQRIAGSDTRHRARLMQEFLRKVEKGDVGGLPSRLGIFGVSSLPPAIWNLLSALGRHIEIDLFLLNPSQEYWGQLKRGEAGEGAHPLLASLGQQGRDFIGSVVASGANEPVGGDAFVLPPQASLLGVMQGDLLLQRVRAPAERITVGADDDSVQVHVCHSALREMEVLHDQLLMLFSKHPDLMPDDVLVMCSDIQRYAPLADAVFGTRQAPEAIPYTIADRRLEAEQPLLRRFSELLALPGSRFEAERVLALLEEPALRARFELAESDIPLVRRWCEELHLRWGRDAEDRRQRGLPDDVPLSWREALSRLLAGFALPVTLAPDHDRRFGGIAPAELVFSVSHAQVMTRLVAFVESLLHWERRLHEARPLEAWADTLDGLVAAFFAETPESRDALLCVHNVIAELREQARLADDAAPQPFAVLRTWIKGELSGLESRHGFLHGAVTFCAMVPMRSLPFKVIAVLGLDDGVFPRQQKPWSFDLMVEQPLPGDRSRRQDDRYLFLETVMAARQVLYLSHVGASDIDGSLRAPSPVLSEFIDQMRRTVDLDETGAFARRFITRHALQPFSPRYFGGDARLFSFEPRMAAASQVVAGEASGALPAVATFASALPPPDSDLLAVTLPRLERFLSHPQRFFLRERLGVQLPMSTTALSDDEPVTFTATRELRQRLFHAPALDVACLRAEGLLPGGVWGARLLQAEAGRVARLRERRDELDTPPLPALDFAWQWEDIRLGGPLVDLTPQGIVRVSLENTVYATDLLQLRLSHLLLCLLKPAGIECRSRLLGLRQSYTLEPVDNPAAALADFLAAYRDGLSQPLPLFRRASPAYVKEGQSLDKARKEYRGGDYSVGDAEDAWIRLLWRDADPVDARFAHWADRLYGPLAEVLKQK